MAAAESADPAVAADPAGFADPAGPADPAESERAAALLDAQDKAEQLFAEIDRRGLVAPGRVESAVSTAVRDLGAEMFGTSRHWHKRVVRSGVNTLEPYTENPPDRVIAADDVVFVDLGPVFAGWPGTDGWEADVGRTWVLGDDPAKRRLLTDLPQIFDAGRAHFEADPDITGEALYAAMGRLAADAGWELGSPHSGHLVGEFPHELVDAERRHSYITPGNDTPMRTVDAAGRRCHWILEVHVVDRARGFGGFLEQLLTL